MGDYRVVRPYLDAIRFDGENVNQVAEFLGVDWPDEFEPADHVLVELPDGDHIVRIGDYITRRYSTDETPLDELAPRITYRTCPGTLFEYFYEPFDPTDRISPPDDSDDAMAWAESFESFYPHSGCDAGLMVGWFANYWAACKASAQ
jgi:hypothetical protein